MPPISVPQELRFVFTHRAPLLRRVTNVTMDDIARLSRLIPYPPVGVAITFEAGPKISHPEPPAGWIPPLPERQRP